MKEILKNLFKINRKKPKKEVREKFIEAFPGAINEEWISEGNLWEVVFYHDQREKIAKISKAGILEELRTNIPLSELPQKINDKLQNKGEIMSAISIKKALTLTWEIIYRNESLIRFVCNLDEKGKETSCTQL